MGFRGAFPLPNFRVYDREEDIGIRENRVHVGDVQLVHFRHRGPVHGGSAHNEALVLSGQFGLFVSLLEGVDAGDLRDRVSPQVEDDVLAARQRAEGQRKIRGAAHNHRIAFGLGLEILEVFRDVPGKLVFDADAPVIGHGNY